MQYQSATKSPPGPGQSDVPAMTASPNGSRPPTSRIPQRAGGDPRMTARRGGRPEPVRRLLIDLAVAIGIVAAATAISTALFAVFGGTRIGIVFLSAVMLAGAYRGMASSIAAALLATLSYNYFLTGRALSFQLPTADELHNLVLFCVAAVITGTLTSRIKASERSAIRRTGALETLLEVERVAQTAEDEGVLFKRVNAAINASLPVLNLTVSATPRPTSSSTPSIPRRSSRDIRVDGDVIGHLTWSSGPAEFDEFIDLLAERLSTSVAGMRSRTLGRKLQIERSRNLLLASVSHDFRTPLATIITASSTLIDFREQLDDSQRLRLLTAARDEAERLDQFVNQLLEAMRRAPDGAITASAKVLDVRTHLQALADRFNAPALWPQVKVSGARCRILADEILFSQAFSNIIENAVKHSPIDGSVVIKVRRAGDRVEVVVSDSGPGVPEDDLAHIFDRYFQAGPDKHGSGYGIGLAVARFNVEAMGGELRASNKPHSGLQITATFAAGMADEDC